MWDNSPLEPRNVRTCTFLRLNDRLSMSDAMERAGASPSRVTLPDGRGMAYAEYGDPEGAPFIFMHGVPSSRLAGAMFHDAACASGIRLIAPDRPGYGYSDDDPGRTILDWPRDVTALADALDIRDFGVMGISGAVPYLLACAVAIPQRLTHLAILSGLGPLREPGVMTGMNRESAALYRLALRSPRLGRLWMRMLARTARQSPLLVFRQQMSYLPPVDRVVFARPELRELRLADMAEAFRQQAAGAEQEAVLHVTDWGFALTDVGVRVFLWQGIEDRHHPPAMGQYLARALPDVQPVFAPGEGAFSFLTSMEDIFGAIVACPTRNELGRAAAV